MPRPDGEGLGDDEHRRVAQEMYDRWKAGESKSALEAEYWRNMTSNGKAFSAYIRTWLDIDTEKRSRQAQRVEELERTLRAHGIPVPGIGEPPDWYLLVTKARESALAAIRAFNDPTARYRTEQFILMMVIAWNSLLQAILGREDIDYYEYDNAGEPRMVDGQRRVLDIDSLIGLAGDQRIPAAVAENLRYFMRLRNQIAHRYLPALDSLITGYAQSMVLNFEELLVGAFGTESVLGDELYLPIHIGRFRRTPELKRTQAQLPPDLITFLEYSQQQVPEEILGDPKYCMRIFFVATAANRESSADTTVTFVKPDEISDELRAELSRIAVVTRPRHVGVASGDLMRPGEVVAEMSNRLDRHFTMHTHTQCWKHFQVRPPSGSDYPESTDSRYCLYDSLARAYGYTRAWVDKLVKELADATVYATVTGH